MAKTVLYNLRSTKFSKEMNFEPREQIGGLFKTPKIWYYQKKCIFTDFNKMFPHKFIVVADKKSNHPRQYYIQEIYFVYL